MPLFYITLAAVIIAGAAAITFFKQIARAQMSKVVAAVAPAKAR